MRDGSLDFSFSGLKSAVARLVREQGVEPVRPGGEPSAEVIAICRSFQQAAVATLMRNVMRAAADWRPRSLLVAGGVACNSYLRERARALGGELGMAVHLPSPRFATDNAAMVAALGGHLLAAGVRDDETLDIDPDLAPGDDVRSAAGAEALAP